MALPLIIGALAATGFIGGATAGTTGVFKLNKANDTLDKAKKRHKKNTTLFEIHTKKVIESMDNLGKLELEILEGFIKFENVVEKITNRPEFEPYNKDGVQLPKYEKKELSDVSIGAGILLGGLGGASLGTAGAFAASSATTSAVMAFGTASTGTAISALSGAAATNATLAALGGGSLAAGGGGMALGSLVLGAAGTGVGILFGGIIFSVVANSLSKKADIAYEEMLKAEKEITKCIEYNKSLTLCADEYLHILKNIKRVYDSYFEILFDIVEVQEKGDWNNFNEFEKEATKITFNLVALLYDMCKLQLIKKSKDNSEENEINLDGINDKISKANDFISATSKEIENFNLNE